MNYSCDELFDELPARKHVVVIGESAEAGCQLLRERLRKEGCEVVARENFERLDQALLKDVALVFIVIGGLPAHALYAQVNALVQRVRHISVIPVVQYADQEKAAALLELGCVDYLLSPFSDSQLTALLRRQEYANAAQESFVSCSQAGRRLLAMAQRVSLTRAPIQSLMPS